MAVRAHHVALVGLGAKLLRTGSPEHHLRKYPAFLDPLAMIEIHDVVGVFDSTIRAGPRLPLPEHLTKAAFPVSGAGLHGIRIEHVLLVASYAEARDAVPLRSRSTVTF